MTTLLLLALILTILITILFVQNQKNTLKEKKEDILKFIYNQSKKNQSTNIQNLKSFSKLKISKLIKIIELLIKEKKVKYDEENIKLTLEGLLEAKKIIEKHRKIEKKLFEETSINLEDIHQIAEKEEHKEKILESPQNYPCIDHHGDPIKEHDIKSICLTKILENPQNINKIYKIVHIEDEPPEIYKKIINLDIAPFEFIKIKQINSTNINILTSKGQKIKLDIITCANIFVTESNDPNTEEEFKKIESQIEFITTLDKLKINEQGKIIGLSFYLRGEEKRRILEMGFVKNTIITPIYNNMLGNDPRVYKIKNTKIALRKEQAQKIYVQKITN